MLEGIDEQALINQIQNEYQMRYSTVIKKRIKFRKQDEYLNNTQDDDKIDLKTLYYIVDRMMAIYYSDEMVVEFQEKTFADRQQAKNLNSLAKFDYNEMDMPLLNYEVQMNRFMRGVGIRISIGWDSVTQVPLWQSVDARQWIPDPNGWFDPKGFRFHGFEFSVAKSELREEDGYDEKAVSTIKVAESSEEKNNRIYGQKSAGLSPNEEMLSGDNELVDVYHHFTTHKGKKLLVSLANNRRTIIRIKEIEPVLEEEKADPTKIMFPVVLNYFSPQKYNPYGTSLVDLILDKHRYRNLFANLMFNREKDLALGDDIIYDTNLITNKNDLTKATFNKKYIGVDATMGSMAGAVQVLPKNPTSSSTINFDGYLSTAISYATGIDARQLGIQGDRTITATEAQMLQANNNLTTIFKNRINNIGEKWFWKLWYRSYMQNFDSADKKIVRVTGSFGNMNVEFKKKDFITKQDPDVEIKSKADINAIKEKQKANLTPLLLAYSQNPALSQYQRDLANRKLLELNDVEDDYSIAITGQSYEELDALNKLELINMGIKEGALIDNMDVNHYTYITIFQRAIDGPIKSAAIRARQQAIIEMGMHKPVPMEGGGNQMANVVQNATTNNAIQQGNNPVISKANAM